MSSKSVFVTGATGQQGGAVARLLLSRGHKVRALVRKPESEAAQALRAAGAELIAGSMDDAGALVPAMRGADSVFAVTTPFEAGMDAEVRQGKNVADAVQETGAHLVFTSVAWAWAKTGIPHFESKWEVEEHIRALGIPHTIVGPAFFMENATSPFCIGALRQGTLPIPLGETVPNHQIAMQDIAEFAVLAIEQPERMRGRRVDIAGDVLTGAESAAILSRAAGCPIAYYAVPLQAIRAQSEDLGIMFEYFETKQPKVDIAALKRDYPEIRWKTYEQWASEQDWGRLLMRSAGA